jgi:hypothetical protein
MPGGWTSPGVRGVVAAILLIVAGLHFIAVGRPAKLRPTNRMIC